MGLIKQAIEARVAAEAAERAGQPVVITIARDFGAEGHEIGKMLSTLLGIPLYDNELLVRSAMRTGESVDKMAAYDERMAAEFMAFLPDRVDSRTLSDKLFRSMSQVILDLGATQSCIIEGRLSDYLLRNNPNHKIRLQSCRLPPDEPASTSAWRSSAKSAASTSARAPSWCVRCRRRARPFTSATLPASGR